MQPRSKAEEAQRADKLKALEKEEKEITEAQKAAAKDSKDIAKQEQNIEVNRAEKEAAKASGNPVDQASQSVQIGVNKAAIAGERADREKARMQEESPAAGKPSPDSSPNAISNKHSN